MARQEQLSAAGGCFGPIDARDDALPVRDVRAFHSEHHLTLDDFCNRPTNSRPRQYREPRDEMLDAAVHSTAPSDHDASVDHCDRSRGRGKNKDGATPATAPQSVRCVTSTQRGIDACTY